MMQKKIKTKQVAEITGYAQSTIRGRKAGTHVLTRTGTGKATGYFLDEVERFAAGMAVRKRFVDNVRHAALDSNANLRRD